VCPGALRQWLLLFGKPFSHFLDGRAVCLMQQVVTSQKTQNINVICYFTMSTEVLWLFSVSTQAFWLFTVSTQCAHSRYPQRKCGSSKCPRRRCGCSCCPQKHSIPQILRPGACRQQSKSSEPPRYSASVSSGDVKESVEMFLQKHAEAHGGLWYSHCTFHRFLRRGKQTTKLIDRLMTAFEK
jgi:hypothetical protein